MNRTEYEYLLAERSELQRLLADTSDDEVLVRGSFLARLERVESQLAAVETAPPLPAQARLTFRGRPVVGGHGIFAEFGIEATSKFVKAVTTMAAAVAKPLGSSGPIPNRDQNRLLITGTAVGSFGFELEEYLEPEGAQLSLGLEAESAVARALRQTLELLGGTLGSDDALTDAVATVDPRARVEVRSFLETLVAHEAVCALEPSNGAPSVQFGDVGQVRRSIQRLGQDNVHEAQRSFEGTFQGVLPDLRTFEFRIAGEDSLVRGKIGPAIINPNELNRRLYLPTRIRVTEVRVGAGRPRYVLNEQPEWLDQPSPSTSASQ